jgi:hypothetical protein
MYLSVCPKCSNSGYVDAIRIHHWECDIVEARYDEYYPEIHNILALCPDDHIQRVNQASMDTPYLHIWIRSISTR